jgi:PKD repeat protein
LSGNATSYTWLFVGSSTGVSNAFEPTGICYNSPGDFNVILIAYNSTSADTLVLTNYIHVVPLPAISLAVSNDTLVASPVYPLYNWYLDAAPLSSIEDTLYMILPGWYSVSVTDSNGCVNSTRYPYQIDTTLSAAFHLSTYSICKNNCISVINTSLNAVSYQWFFPGGNPSTSTDENPSSICYDSAGVFNIILVVSDGSQFDTLTQFNCLTVHETPIVSLQMYHDTILADPGFALYTWTYNGNVLQSGTNDTLIATLDGYYGITVIDTNGCTSESDSVLYIEVGVKKLSVESIKISPNPNTGHFRISGLSQSENNIVSIYNLLGEKVLEKKTSEENMDCILSEGVYLVRIGETCRKVIVVR